MASQLVVDAVEARLAANWTNCPVRGANASGDVPADGSAFLVVQYPVANEEHIALGPVGQRTFRELGGIRFVLSMPAGQGASFGLGWADQLRALFRAQQFAGVSCLAASPPRIDDGNESGGYFRLSVVVEYYADILA
jgi:hypothetical protein